MTEFGFFQGGPAFHAGAGSGFTTRFPDIVRAKVTRPNRAVNDSGALRGAVDAAVTVATEQFDEATETEKAALLTASDGRDLSDEAIAYIRAVLNL